MTFKISTRKAHLRDAKFVEIRYSGVTFEEELLDSRDYRDLASEFLDAALELSPDLLDEDKAEFQAEGVRQCCDWLRKEGHGELADKMINYV